MIKFECNDDCNLFDLELDGTPLDITAEYISLGSSIFNAIKFKLSEKEANAFRLAVAYMFSHPDSVVWDSDDWESMGNRDVDDDDDLSKGDEDDGAKIISFHPQ